MTQIDQARLEQFVGQAVGDMAALGAQAGEARLTEVLTEAGFTRVRRRPGGPVCPVGGDGIDSNR